LVKKSKISHLDSDNQSELNLYDPTNPDVELFDLFDDELIKLSGSKLLYYKYNISKAEDTVYEEEQTKHYSRQPVVVFGHYDPKAVDENLTGFGLTQESEQVFTFNKQYITRKLGRLPLEGDILEAVFQKLKFKIFQVQEDAFESYGIYHLICTAKILRGSESIIPDTRPQNPMGNQDY
jgi:hypothetical protein